MFEPFTNVARKAMAIANQETHRRQGAIISDSELFFGILRQEESSAAVMLRNFGLDLTGVRREVEQRLRPLSDISATGRLPQTPEVKRAVELAIEIARDLGHKQVETAHLLLGLLQQPGIDSSRLLAAHGISFAQAQRAITKQAYGKDSLAARAET